MEHSLPNEMSANKQPLTRDSARGRPKLVLNTPYISVNSKRKHFHDTTDSIRQNIY